MVSVGIVGAGIAGLHLALYLQRHGVDCTIHSDRSGEELREGRLPNTVALMGATRARDTELGVNHWNEPEQGTHALKIRIAGDPPLVLQGEVDEPFLLVDMRVYVPRLMDDFADRGGKIVVGRCDSGDIAKLAAGHDLMVIATGRAGLTAMFARLPERSPYREPQRRLFAGLFHGIRMPKRFTIEFNIIPGHGEIFENQFLTQNGVRSGLLIEAIPGGLLEPLTHLRYEDNPTAFNHAVLALLREHAPDTFARADPKAFALTGPLDVLSGAVTPAVRKAVAPLNGGKFAIALGDAHITHDPIVGQGANAASRAAWILGQMIVEQVRLKSRFAEAFCAHAEERLWEETSAVTEWSNAFLQPPPPHAIGLLVAAAQNKALANAFASNFNHPKRQWEIMKSPEATAAFVASFGASLPVS